MQKAASVIPLFAMFLTEKLSCGRAYYFDDQGQNVNAKVK